MGEYNSYKKPENDRFLIISSKFTKCLGIWEIPQKPGLGIWEIFQISSHLRNLQNLKNIQPSNT